MRKPLALDLFCKAGGATKGLQLAGFEVVGVDIEPQPRYCGDDFVRADALDCVIDPARFDFVWASPPCQKHTAMKTMHNAKPHVDLIPQIREKLKASGVPYAIENVVGAPLIDPITLCGTTFDLGCEGAELRRHRCFETSFPMLWLPPCSHTSRPVIGIYGGHVRNRRRRPGSSSRGVEDFPIQAAHEVMGINWMTLAELSQAIPPAYSQFIGHAALAYIESRRLAA